MPGVKATIMKDNNKLTRHWQEKAIWLSLLLISLYFLGRHIIQGASIFRILSFSVYTLFATWGTTLAITKPDALIKDNNIYLFGRLRPQPLTLSLDEIQSIERHSELPIWRVQPLRFNLKDGRQLTFSTGGNESRMKRIIKFIETETVFKIKTS